LLEFIAREHNVELNKERELLTNKDNIQFDALTPDTLVKYTLLD